MPAPAPPADQAAALATALASALAPAAAADARPGAPQTVEGPVDPALPPGTGRLAALLDSGPGGGLDGHLVLALPATATAAGEELLDEVGQALTPIAGAPVRVTEVAAPPATGSWIVVPLVGPDAAPVGALALQLTAEPAQSPAPAGFAPLPGVATPPVPSRHRLDLLAEVEMSVTAELGRTRLPLRQLLALTTGAVVELDRAAGSPVDVLVNGTLIARGEVVVIDEEYGIRITEVVSDGPNPGA